ncbi:hypothetical protein ScPMuIL_004897 [Solemya velum]
MAADCCDVRLYNIIIVGMSFLLLFTAFQTGSMAQKSVLDSVKKESNGTFTGDGYISLSIIYVVFSFSNWIVPSIIVLIGAKFSMFFGSLMYTLFILQFLKPMTWALYLGSVLVGLGAAMVWTAQGNCLTVNSDAETVSRNSGIFWALLQCSLLFGNMYSHFTLTGNQITSDERTKLFAVLTGAAVLGNLCFLLLRKPGSPDSDSVVNLNSSGTQEPTTVVEAFKKSFRMMKTSEMLLLSITIAYTGVELTFFSGVYGTCLSNTLHFGEEAKGLIGISGMFIGAGEIIGGAVFGLFGRRTNLYGRDPIIFFGYVVHTVCFYLIFINIPENAPIQESSEATYIVSNEYVAILCSFLLGLGDSSFNTQLYSLLGSMYPEDSSPAFALFKFVQSICAAAAFYYSTVLILQYQLLILVVMGTLGMLTFCIIEWRVTKFVGQGYIIVPTEEDE